ncbi:hypothetical protein AGDE_10653 [Angomonas deanei]|uniref:Uncharacterized protein n=1 Tax=Angomonas deanei TaxID=59799 RepID=A0A7G2CFV2_9TRYP|nr:hypothetical protein AGDE_10653 [Angomonas deanei]CAD2217841.1 hypothetical protein, conserved [Angomonas deanei]|eukprot:EPY27664.1 hypothetical protein AGDE_10653 [Angomonas deanei]
MKKEKLIEFSLSKSKIEKLIIFLGYESQSNIQCRGSVGLRVSKMLLDNCRPGLNDIHDPDVCRAHGRDSHGRSRRGHGLAEKKGSRGPQLWDSERVPDYSGLWCDRLLLGHHESPSRTAIFVPHVPSKLIGDAVGRVAQSHRHLPRDSILLVKASSGVPFGGVELEPNSQESLSEETAPSGLPSLHSALQNFGSSRRGCDRLWIGVGNKRGHLDGFSAAETAVLERHTVPLASFAAALWTINPERCAQYLKGLPQDPSALPRSPTTNKLWHSMQFSMLSTRDCALLHSRLTGNPLDARLSDAQRNYLIETLLHRLGER